MTDSLFPEAKRSRKLRLLVATAVVIGLAVLGRFVPVGAWLTTLVATLRGAGVAGAALFMLVYTPGALLFVPSALFTFAAGFAYGPFWAPVIAVPGIALSSWVVFVLSRTVLRKTIQQWLGRDPRFAVIDPLLTRFGPKAVVLLRFSPLSPFSVLNFAFGLTGMKSLHYFIASAIGTIPGVIFYSQLGALAPQLEDIASGKLPAGGRTQTYFLCAGLILTVIVAVWLGRMAKEALAHVDRRGPDLSS